MRLGGGFGEQQPCVTIRIASQLSAVSMPTTRHDNLLLW